MNFKQDLKKVMILYPDLEVQSEQDFRSLVNIHNILEATFNEKPDYKLVKASFEARKTLPLNTPNDYYYLIFKSAMRTSSLKKFAYPNNSEDLQTDEEFDIEKWAGLVHKIYQAVDSGDMTLNDAIDYYAETLDQNNAEDEMFKKWIKYYQSGEHLKYSSLEDEIKKEGFQFPLSAPGFYGPENAVIPKKEPVLDRFKNLSDQKNNYTEWKNKLYSAIRRIDKLLRQSDDYIEPEAQRDLADLLHQFDQEVRALRHEITASDLALKYANKFKKLGFDSGYNEFYKYAQEAALPEDVPSESVEAPTPESAPGISPEQAPGEVAEGGSPLERAFHGGTPDDSEPGAKEGEYEKIEGPVDLNDAVAKLEEIAGRLSDRRTIRLLAEFDIILDKIGIAPMFPELAEAQSKLIDGYSYALTRVTKMLGMLSSGKSLSEISSAKTTELTDRTMKEVNKTFEGPKEQPTERGAPAIQKGLEEAPTPPAPEAAARPTPAPEV